MRLCTLVTSACVGIILLSLMMLAVRKRHSGKKMGEREVKRREREREIVGERERERGMEVTAVMVKTTAHLCRSVCVCVGRTLQSLEQQELISALGKEALTTSNCNS